MTDEKRTPLGEIIPFGDIEMWTVRWVYGSSEHALAQTGPDFAALLAEYPIYAISPGRNAALAVASRLAIAKLRKTDPRGRLQVPVYNGIFRIGQPVFLGSWQALFVMPMTFTENTQISRTAKVHVGPKPNALTDWRNKTVDPALVGAFQNLANIIRDRAPEMAPFKADSFSAGTHSSGGAMDVEVTHAVPSAEPFPFRSQWFNDIATTLRVGDAVTVDVTRIISEA